jgi:glutamate N-acetyltransferase/amino-acid N-acetyltransferase
MYESYVRVQRGYSIGGYSVMSIVDVPKGYLFAVAEAAIKAPGRNDLALIYSEENTTFAGVFTANKVKAAPVLMDMVRARYNKGRAVVINSGNANACTGQRGMLDARSMATEAASALDIDEKRVYVCSTGVIGVPLPMKQIKPAIGKLAKGLGKATAEDVAKAIMTTDSFAKLASRKVKIGKSEGTILGICKGAGMIEPNMATMLCFFMTDIDVDSSALKSALVNATDSSFNSITVDGECSTNDTAMIFSNSKLDNEPLTLRSDGFKKFQSALVDLSNELARMIVKDGEGATKLIEVKVQGAKNETHAKRAAKAIANSLLVKTAVYGKDPNWGRIMGALGQASVPLTEEKIDISFGKTKVVSGGLATKKVQDAVKEMQGDEVLITVDLGLGKAETTVLTCDLTEKYIEINAEYTT